MTKIEEIWNELERDNSFSHGLLIRRYSSETLPDLYAAIKLPENNRCIVASFKKVHTLKLDMFSEFKVICLELIPEGAGNNRNYLVFKLIDSEHKDIFAVLCEDLFESVVEIDNESKLFKELLNRFAKWKSLFESISSHGLSPEEQRGLYGELFFLRKLLQNKTNYSAIIRSWIGCERQIRDFQLDDWSVEVKTSIGNNYQKVYISSERQLDTLNLRYLYLYHLSIESRQHAGETLNQIVDSISLMLTNDLILSNKFKIKLLSAGYVRSHSIHYDENGYVIRNQSFYIVKDDFPRIEESWLESGIGDVKYSILLSQCRQYLQTENEVFETLYL